MIALAGLSLAAWLVFRSFRGGFWRADQRLSEESLELERWPNVTAVVPARNEATTVGRTVASLLAQDYPGPLQIVVVDDESEDDTAAEALAAARGSDRVAVITGAAPPAEWTGKLWAVHQGLSFAIERWPATEYWWLVDADTEHDPPILHRLIAKAEIEGHVLVSLMVLLHCKSFWERLLVPAFVFFFQKLYPFARVNDPNRSGAAAAGGCMLLRRSALAAAGGVAAVRGRLIDDCALAERMKKQGAIWLGLTTQSRSVRSYRLADFWKMVTRTAFTQLRYAFGYLLLTVSGMMLIYSVPPVATMYGLFTANTQTAVIGGIAWVLMAVTMRPTLRLYRLPAWWGFFLPAAAVLFTVMTVDSARLHWQGRGALWKGRRFGRICGERG